jgi:hypothetical protein
MSGRVSLGRRSGQENRYDEDNCRDALKKEIGGREQVSQKLVKHQNSGVAHSLRLFHKRWSLEVRFRCRALGIRGLLNVRPPPPDIKVHWMSR